VRSAWSQGEEVVVGVVSAKDGQAGHEVVVQCVFLCIPDAQVLGGLVELLASGRLIDLLLISL
jgi:hypothetical protein